MSSQKTILVVEDESKIAALLEDYLQADGYLTQAIGNGDAVMPWLAENHCDAILLDLMLPGTDGLTLCRLIREQGQTPILMLTARVEEIDRLLGLELGADDYICKPFSPREVVARVKAVLRRTVSVDALNSQQQGLVLDEKRYEARCKGVAITFTAVEFHLLQQLCKEPGRIFSRQQLMDGMYSDNRIVSDRTIDSHIKKIRKKLAEAAPDQDFIGSVYGVGYRLEAEASAK